MQELIRMWYDDEKREREEDYSLGEFDLVEIQRCMILETVRTTSATIEGIRIQSGGRGGRE